MYRTPVLGLCLLLCAARAAHAAPTVDILFVGNSFTYGQIEPVASYNRAAIADLNGTRQGGVPGIFKKFTAQAGLSYNVAIEAVGGETLANHAAYHAPQIAQPKWEAVVLQEYSTRPLPTARGGDPAAFDAGVTQLTSMIRGANPAASIFLYETWARPNLFVPADSPYATGTADAMQADLHDGYYAARAAHDLTGVAPVGDAFLAAISAGIADPTSYGPAAPGTLPLWDLDHYHASKYGSYLSAAVLYSRITGNDPRGIDAGPGSAAADLAISPADATALARVAYYSTTPGVPGLIDVPEPATAATLILLAIPALARRRHHAPHSHSVSS